ncbi:MAG: HEAT repeat domain-containing protein [bacterium]|nr:HEAT repeat domain-containing protein [bacterium]
MKHYMFVIVGLLFYINSYARDNYNPQDNRPLSMVIHEDYLINSYVNMDFELIKKHSIIKYNFTDSSTEIITDVHIPETANSIAENSKYIFVGGTTGLGVYDKAQRKWESWYGDSVNIVEANDKKVWLGTMAGVVEIDQSNKANRHYTMGMGLNNNKIYSLHLYDDQLYVGTYRNGTGTYAERRGDMFGTGLNSIDLNSQKIRNVPIPMKSTDIVLDIYPIVDMPNGIRIVTGCWYIAIFDYNTVDGKIIKKKSKDHHIEGVLSKCGKDIHSRVADNLVKYIMKVGLNHWPYGGLPCPVASEIVKLLYDKEDHSGLEKLLQNKNDEIRLLSIWGLVQITTDRSSNYLIDALNDESNGVVTEAAKCLGNRKEKKAIPNLKKVFKKHTNQKSFFALNGLLILDPEIAKEIIETGDPFENELLISVVKICNIKEPINKLVNDPNEKVEIRNKAKAILDKSKY